VQQRTRQLLRRQRTATCLAHADTPRATPQQAASCSADTPSSVHSCPASEAAVAERLMAERAASREAGG
jgi:hypothetical protein